MDCQNCRGVLQAYLDEELDEEESFEVEEHIRICSECAEEFRQLRGINDIVQRAFRGTSARGNKITATVLMSITRTTQEERKTAVERARKQQREEKEEAKHLIGKTVAGYKIVELLGTGGMGSVYKAIQISMEREVALKVLSRRLSKDETYVARFIREARAAGELNHPNIVRVYDVGHEGDIYFFSMEYLEGESVYQRVVREGRMNVLDALDVALQVAMALGHAHSKGIIHRDVKPENIMIEKDGTVKITDLGLAKRSLIPEDSVVTIDGQIMGTPFYMSPEQIADSSSVDYRADIYSLGASLYFMVTGERPFADRGSLMEVMASVLREGIRFSRSHSQYVPVQVKRLIKRLCASDPRARPQTAEAAADEIERVLRGPLTLESEQRKHLPVMGMRERVHKKRSAAPFFIAVAAVALIVVVLMFALGEREKLPVVRRHLAEPQPKVEPEPIRPEPRPVETPTPEPKVDAVAQMGLRELEEAKRFEEDNPEAYSEILRRYQRIARDYKGKMPARAAQSEYDRLIAELNEKYAEEEKVVDTLIKEGRYDDAKSRLMVFCKKFADTPQEEKASNKIREVDRIWEKVSKQNLKAAEELIRRGKLEKAEEMLKAVDKMHPIVRSSFIALKGKVRRLLAEKKEHQNLLSYERMCFNFYREMADVLLKGDVEQMHREIEVKKNSYKEISEEVGMFTKDVNTLSVLYRRVIESLQKQSSRFPVTLQLANGEALTGRVRQQLGASSFMLDMGTKGKQGVRIMELSPEFVERIASSAYTPDEMREREVGLALFCLVSCRILEARARFDITFPDFSKTLDALSALQSGKPVRYDIRSDGAHYARLYRGVEEPLIRVARRRDFEKLYTALKRDRAAERYEEASVKLQKLLSGEYDEFIDEKIQAELEEIRKHLLAKREEPKRRPEVSRKKTGLLAALSEYFHAASIKQVKKMERTFEFVYDFKDKEQLLDWRFNDDVLNKRRVERIWRAYETARRKRRINYDHERNFSLLPYGVLNVIKLSDSALRWSAVTEGDVVFEVTIIALNCNNIKLNLCENDDGRYIFGWAVGTDEDYRRNVLKGLRHAIVRVDNVVDDEDEHHELIPTHRCYKSYLAVPKKFQRCVLAAKKKKSDLRLYVNGALFASGRDDTYDRGTLAINAYGDASFLVAKVRIQCRLEERWLKKRVLKGRESVKKPKKPREDRKSDDEINRFVKATKKRLKGMTDKDCKELRRALKEAKELQRDSRGIWQPYDLLKGRVERCEDIEELRRLLRDIEWLRKHGRGGPRGGRRRGP